MTFVYGGKGTTQRKNVVCAQLQADIDLRVQIEQMAPANGPSI